LKKSFDRDFLSEREGASSHHDFSLDEEREKDKEIPTDSKFSVNSAEKKEMSVLP